MKTVITLLFALLSICVYSSDKDIAQLISERETRIAEYNLLNDSAIPNKVTKFALLNEKLIGIIAVDSIIISSNNLESNALNDSISNLNESIAKLRADFNRVQDRTVNDLKMILILKVAAAIFIVTILILVYFLITRKPKKEEPIDIDTRISELENIKEGYLREIDRLKSKEHYLIEEHENGVRIQQEHYNQLSKKFNILETEYNQLKQSSVQPITEPQISNVAVPGMKEENEKLVAQVNSLKVQLDDSRAKNQAILRKIDKLISDLSGVNSVS
jgi:hypothetical protein